jgi:hypothetical protein
VALFEVHIFVSKEEVEEDEIEGDGNSFIFPPKKVVVKIKKPSIF